MAKAYVTPAGKAYYPHLNKPDQKYKTFNTGILLDAEGAASFNKALAAFIKENPLKAPKKARMPIEEQEDGTFLVRAKSDYQPGLFDSKNRRLSKDTAVGGGSTIKIAVTFNHYTEQGEGVNLYLKSVQIIDLVEYTGECPFEEVEDGYEGGEGDFAGEESTEDSAGEESDELDL